MPWSCSACTYRNINAGAKTCHVCGTPNANAAVVDLTNTSPKPTQYGGGGDVMESNRRRRRRLESDKKQRSGDNNDATNGSNEDVIDVDLDETMNEVKSTAIDKQRHRNKKKRTNDDDDALVDNEVQPMSRSLDRIKRKRPDERKQEPVQFKSQENGYKKFSSTAKSRQQSHSKGNRPAINDNDDIGQKKRSEESSKRTLTDFYNQNANQPAASVESLMERASHILQSTFKLKSLRPLQKKAIQGALGGNSQIIIMATGGGKSLCYQLPILACGSTYNQALSAKNSRVTIVVCPLIALMIDQVNNLMKKGVMTAACWSSSHSAKDKAHIMKRLSVEKEKPTKKASTKSDNVELTPIQMLYVTPELIETQRFRDVLMKLHSANRLFMFAIDEAHCLSTWGHDFRPAYRKLTWISESFQDVPIMACTGTATAQVINDIRSTLGFGQEVPCHLGTFNRPNIEYKVKYKDSLNTEPQGAINDLIKEVKKQHVTAEKEKQPCAGIIYVHKREDCQSLATQIYKSTGILAAPYHAGLKDAAR